jgi:alpha-beta hydrolase superfamily lysophospholipase
MKATTKGKPLHRVRTRHGKWPNMAWDDIDLDALRRLRNVSYYFRYPLTRRDFHVLRMDDRAQGHYASKALYSGFTPDGRVDRTTPYNGDIATLFLPLDARVPADAQLLLTHIDPGRIVHPNGSRNWAAIRDAAENRIRETLRQRESGE